MKGVSWLCGICDRKKEAEILAYNQRVNAELKSRWKEKGHEIEVLELLRENLREMSSDSEHAQTTNEYIVFIDVAGDIDWIYCDENSKDKLSPKSSALISRAMAIEASPGRYLGSEKMLAFKKTLGYAIVSAIDKKYDDAERLMQSAQNYFADRTAEMSRIWTMMSAIILASLMALFLAFLLPELAVIETVPFIMGLIGAFVAIVGKSGNQNRDANAGMLLHILDTMSRLTVGALLGWVGVLAFSCPIVPVTLEGLCDSEAGNLVIAFSGGLFEYFIPTMISRCVVTPFKTQEN